MDTVQIQGGAPASGLELKTLPVEKLLDLLPAEKLFKLRGKTVATERPPSERAVLDELWRRYMAHHRERHREPSIRSMCPPQEDPGHFYKTTMADAYDAFLRLVTRNGIGLNFFQFVDRMVKNKALDLRRAITKQRKPRRSAEPERETRSLPPTEMISLEEIQGTIAEATPAKQDTIVAIRKVLEEYAAESPENAMSLHTLTLRELEGMTLLELRGVFAASVAKIKEFVDSDCAKLQIRFGAIGALK